MDRRRNEPQQAGPRLVLVTPAIEDAARFAPQLAAACAAADVAAVILRLAPGSDSDLLARIRALAPAVQQAGAALLLDARPDLVNATEADGAHVRGGEEARSARAALGPNRTVGAGGLASRHDAMLAGEAGADYVMFGEPEIQPRLPVSDLAERVAWWAEVFVVPCVAYARQHDEIPALVNAGANFIALGEETVWNAPEGAVRALAEIALLLDAKEPAQ